MNGHIYMNSLEVAWPS